MSMPVAVQVSEVSDYKQIIQLSRVWLRVEGHFIAREDLSPVVVLTEAGPPL